MSCHNIGHALNSVQRKIIEKYELGKIDKETTRDLLIRCVRAVGFCDGNEYEATASFDAAYCSDCMRKVADGKKLYDTFWIDVEPWKVRKYHNSLLSKKRIVRLPSETNLIPGDQVKITDTHIQKFPVSTDTRLSPQNTSRRILLQPPPQIF